MANILTPPTSVASAVHGPSTLTLPLTAGAAIGDMEIVVTGQIRPVGTAGGGVGLPAGYTVDNLQSVIGSPSFPQNQQIGHRGVIASTSNLTLSYGANTLRAFAHGITINGTDGVLHSLASVVHSDTGSPVTITAPDPAPSGPATILVFGLGVRASSPLGFTTLWDDIEHPGSAVPQVSTAYYKTVAGGSATPMPFDSQRFGIWHSCWVTPPIVDNPAMGFRLGKQRIGMPLTGIH